MAIRMSVAEAKVRLGVKTDCALAERLGVTRPAVAQWRCVGLPGDRTAQVLAQEFAPWRGNLPVLQDMLSAAWSAQPVRRLVSVPVRPSRYAQLGDVRCTQGARYMWWPRGGTAIECSVL